MIDDISPPGSWVRELSARPHTYRDVWAALREAEARLAKVEAERDALRAALRHCAAIAHTGGLADLSTEGAMNLLRALTLPHWDRSGYWGDHTARAQAAAARETT